MNSTPSIAPYPPITEHTFDEIHLMRTWSQDGFTVELYETGGYIHGHHTAVGYRFFDSEWSQADAEPLFEGTDYGIPRGKVIDDDDAVRGLVGFLSCRPGDTDADYFDDYTPRQLAWCEERAEMLSLWGLDDVDMETGEQITD